MSYIGGPLPGSNYGSGYMSNEEFNRQPVEGDIKETVIDSKGIGDTKHYGTWQDYDKGNVSHTTSNRQRGGFLASAKNREILKQTLSAAGKIFGSKQEEDEGMGGGVTGTGKGFGGSGATLPGVGAVMIPGEHAPFTVAGMKGSKGWGGAVGKLAGGIIGNVIAPGAGGVLGSQIGETVGDIV